MMRLAADYSHDEFVTLGGVIEANCRVRIFEPDPQDPDGRAARPVVVLTHDQLASEPTENFTVEFLATEILVRFALPGSRTAFVGHHETDERLPDAYDLVTFERVEPELRRLEDGRFALTLGEPTQQPLSPALVDNLLAGEEAGKEAGP